MTPEGIIKNEILGYLSTLPECFVWPNDSTGIWDAQKKIFRKKNSRFHIRGVSDILGIYMGKPLAVEVKSKVGKLSEYQEYFLKRFEASGGIAIVARSIVDVQQKIMEKFHVELEKKHVKTEETTT